MFDTLYCHIGSWKTGTTSIQDTMLRNRALLQDNGIHYIEERRAFLWTSVDRLPDDILQSKQPGARDHFLAAGHSAIATLRDKAETGMPTAVFSNEECMFIDASCVERLAALLREVARRVVVVFYARHPHARIPSAHAQNIKLGMARLDSPLDHFVEDFEAILAPWIAQFGSENVMIRKFEPASMVGGDPVEDFFAAIGSAELFSRVEPVRTNEALSLPALMIASALWASGEKTYRYGPFANALGEIAGARYGLDPERFTPHADQIVRSLAYLSREHGVELAQPELRTVETDRNSLFDDATLASIGKVILEQARTIERLRTELHRRD